MSTMAIPTYSNVSAGRDDATWYQEIGPRVYYAVMSENAPNPMVRKMTVASRLSVWNWRPR